MQNTGTSVVSDFVSRFLDRVQGAANDVEQRCPVGGGLDRRFFTGRLVSEGYSKSGREYISRIAPCSYIVTFLLDGQPDTVELALFPSLNLYYRAPLASLSAGGEQAPDTAMRSLYAEQADPAGGSLDGREDMWVPWADRRRDVPAQIRQAYVGLRKRAPAKKPQAGQGNALPGGNLFYTFDKNRAVESHIRKRYSRPFRVEVPLGESRSVSLDMDLAEFRRAYEELGQAPEWTGAIQVSTSREDAGQTRVRVTLTNTFAQAKTPNGEPDWYDVHLKVAILGDAEILPVECPVLLPSSAKYVLAETRNCALDEGTSDRRCLLLAPTARTQTTRRESRELNVSFAAFAGDPRAGLDAFFTELTDAGLEVSPLAAYQQEVDTIRSNDTAVSALALVSRVYSEALGAAGRWRLHQLAALVKIAARHIRAAQDTEPLVLNVPTAGGKTEGFFAGAMFCIAYDALLQQAAGKHNCRSFNLIKYPMKLLSSDQIRRLAGYSMILDEILAREAGMARPSGIGYMVGPKSKYRSASEVVPRCPRPMPGTSGPCGCDWRNGGRPEVVGGMPTLTCTAGHKLHMGVDQDNDLTRMCPAILVAIWDKFVSQAGQRRLGLLFGAPRYFCKTHGFVDVGETNQVRSGYQGDPPPSIKCSVRPEQGRCCDQPAWAVAPTIPGILVLDEGHLIREAEGTLDSHFETTYLEVWRSLSGRYPVPVISTATIEGATEHLRQLGLARSTPPAILPRREDSSVFFEETGDLKHEAVALVPFDTPLTWAIPSLMDTFFETLLLDFDFDACQRDSQGPEGLGHLRQLMLYCSSYANLNALREMSQGVTQVARRARGRAPLVERSLSARFFDKYEAAEQALQNVRDQAQQIIYATNIASIGIDIDNLDVILFFGLPSNVSEFIQALNRTGRRQGRPAVCLAVLGANKERDISYFKYWPQFVQAADQILEPVPLNRWAYTAIDRTFANVATAVILQQHCHATKRRLWFPSEVLSALQRQEIQEARLIAELKAIYRVDEDPSGYYSLRVEALWERYKQDLLNARSGEYTMGVSKGRWLGSLRLIGKPVRLVLPGFVNAIERAGGRPAFTADVETDQPGIQDDGTADVDQPSTNGGPDE